MSVRASVKPDYLVSLESGRKLKMLKRYLLTSYGMTPDDYRRKWDLPSDYPMVAPNYAAQRKELAHRIGLGRKRPAPAEAAGRRASGRRAGWPTPRSKMRSVPSALPGRAAPIRRDRTADNSSSPFVVAKGFAGNRRRSGSCTGSGM